jgi:hypothetical protein
VSKWSRLLKPFSSLFGSSIGSSRSSDASQSEPVRQIPLPGPRSGLGKLLARATDRFRTIEPPPVQDEGGVVYVPRQDNFDSQTEEGFDAVEILGRDATYDEGLWERLQQSQMRVVKSSNVYSYAWEPEGEDKNVGVLYVTFLHWEPGMKQSERSGPGPTYAYYSFSKRRFEEFQAASEESAGKAVWDFCRVRGSRHAHRHQYRLVSVAGEYVPRKVTAKGFKRRTLIRPGASPSQRKTLARANMMFQGETNLNRVQNENLVRTFRRSTLGDEEFGKPDRGEPNRGRPNRGR